MDPWVAEAEEVPGTVVGLRGWSGEAREGCGDCGWALQIQVSCGIPKKLLKFFIRMMKRIH